MKIPFKIICVQFFMLGAGPSSNCTTPRRSERLVANIPGRFGREQPPANRAVCRCTQGLCLSCRCAQANYFCSDRCACNNNHCRNRPRIVTPIQLVPVRVNLNNLAQLPLNIPVPPPLPEAIPLIPIPVVVQQVPVVIEMAHPPPGDWVQALRDLMTTQTNHHEVGLERLNRQVDDNREALLHQLRQQQLLSDAQQQQLVDQQRQFLDQITRLNARPLVAPIVPIRAVLSHDLVFDGMKGHAVVEWLQRVNQRRVAEGWTEDNTLRAAIGALRAKALEWQDGIGHGINDWTLWSEAIRRKFQTEMNEFQWTILVETRTQGPNELGSDYALAKRTLIARRPTPTSDLETVKILIRGLYNSDHRSAMLINVPGNLQEFIVEIERLESYTAPPLKVSEMAALLPIMSLSVDPAPLVAAAPVRPAIETNPYLAQMQAMQNRMDTMEAELRRSRPPAIPGGTPMRPWTRPTGTSEVNAPTRPVVATGSTNSIPVRPPTPPVQRQQYTNTYAAGTDPRSCWRCNLAGHIARDCPTHPSAPAATGSGNGSAGSTK